MLKKFIFLHIDKAAGTSFRAYLYDNLGRQNVYWHGIDLPCRVSEISADVIGGHIPIAKYLEAGIPLEQTAFFAVLREPISRVVSLYHYFVRNSNPFLDGDIAKRSLRDAVFHSEAFRNKVHNEQVYYISGEDSYDKAVEIMQSQKMLIGTLENLNNFVDYISTRLDFEAKELERHNTGTKGYQSELGLDEDVIYEIKELVKEDIKLYDHVQKQCQGLYTNIEDSEWVELKENLKKFAPAQYKGTVTPTNIIPSCVEPNESIEIKAIYTNSSATRWGGSDVYQLAASYHWLKDSEIYLREGRRTKFQNQSLAPGENLEVTLIVDTPPSPGHYELELTGVHEKVSWFEKDGFETYRIPVEVKG